MDYSVYLIPEAEVDILESRFWYDNKLNGLGVKFFRSIEEKIAQIALSPNAFPIVKSSIRRALVKKFPFAIFFLIVENKIVILAVSHVKRNPRTWIKRTM